MNLMLASALGLVSSSQIIITTWRLFEKQSGLSDEAGEVGGGMGAWSCLFLKKIGSNFFKSIGPFHRDGLGSNCCDVSAFTGTNTLELMLPEHYSLVFPPFFLSIPLDH